MADRTSELVAEFAKEMDARTYDQKVETVLVGIHRVLGRMESQIDSLIEISKIHEEKILYITMNQDVLLQYIQAVEARFRVLEEQRERITELEKQLGTL